MAQVYFFVFFGLSRCHTESPTHKVLTHVEYRAVSGVFQNIDPPPPYPPSECVPPPAPKVVGTQSPGGEGGVGVNILEDSRHRIGLLQYNLSTLQPQ